MGVFDNIGKAEYFESGKYIMPGVYLVRIEKVKQGTTRQKRGFFVVECTILESSNLKDHPLQTPVTWMVMLDQDAAMGNIKHFLSVASDVPFAEVTKEDAEESCSENNPLCGVELRISAVNILTRAKKDFTKVKWISTGVSLSEVQSTHAADAAAGVAAAADA